MSHYPVVQVLLKFVQPIPFFSFPSVLTSKWSPTSWPWLSLSYIPVGRRRHLSQNLALSYFFSPFATSACHSKLTHRQHSWQQLSFRTYLSATDLVSKFSRRNPSCSSFFSWGAFVYLHYGWSWIWVRKKTRTPVGVGLQRGDQVLGCKKKSPLKACWRGLWRWSLERLRQGQGKGVKIGLVWGGWQNPVLVVYKGAKVNPAKNNGFDANWENTIHFVPGRCCFSQAWTLQKQKE